MKVKLRLDYFLMRGGLLGANDVYSHISGGKSFTVTNDADEVNSYQGDEHEYVINSFAPRKNNGSQPVPDDFPVIVVYVDGEKRGIGVASQFRWGNEYCRVIKNWTPNAEKLIEQQIEYDKQQEQPVEELMINAKGNNMSVFTQEMKEAGKYAPVDSKVQVINGSKYDLEYGEDILGLEVTVKSGPVHINNKNIVQIVEYENIAYCFETDMIFPFKSKEDIELDEQVEVLSDKYIDLFSGSYAHPKMAAKGFFKEMQDNGDLPEITLPLETKQ